MSDEQFYDDLMRVTEDCSDPDMAMHPAHRRQRLPDQLHRHVGIGAVLGDPHEVVVELLVRVRIDLHRGLFFIGEIVDQLAQLLEALESEPEAARREEAVAAAPRLRRLLEHEDARAVLLRRERGAHCRVAAADDDDVVCHVGYPMISLIWICGWMFVKLGTSPKSSLPCWPIPFW